MSHYVYLSEGITGKSTRNKPVTPITESTIRSKNALLNTKSKGWFGNFFRSQPEKTKPVVFNQQSKEELYYEKYGIIYSGSDLGSCINSLFQ